jgi:hypothetical protein
MILDSCLPVGASTSSLTNFEARMYSVTRRRRLLIASPHSCRSAADRRRPRWVAAVRRGQVGEPSLGQRHRPPWAAGYLGGSDPVLGSLARLHGAVPHLTLIPRVDRYARVTVRQCQYSVPARLIGRRVRVQR